MHFLRHYDEAKSRVVTRLYPRQDENPEGYQAIIDHVFGNLDGRSSTNDNGTRNQHHVHLDDMSVNQYKANVQTKLRYGIELSITTVHVQELPIYAKRLHISSFQKNVFVQT